MDPFEHVVAEHGTVVMRVCRALLDPVDADDAWSETFLAALRAYPELRPDSNVRGWLVTIAHRKALDQLRQASRRPRSSGEVRDGPSTEGIPEPPDEELRTALAALPDRQRHAVIAHHVAGLPYAEVGDLLDCSEATARRRAADGIASLRTRYPRGTAR